MAQNGGDINLRDKRDRNLLQIALEDAHSNSPEVNELFQENLLQMSLMMLCGLNLKLAGPELEQAKRTCSSKGYAEVLAAIESVTGDCSSQTTQA